MRKTHDVTVKQLKRIYISFLPSWTTWIRVSVFEEGLGKQRYCREEWNKVLIKIVGVWALPSKFCRAWLQGLSRVSTAAPLPSMVHAVSVEDHWTRWSLWFLQLCFKRTLRHDGHLFVKLLSFRRCFVSFPYCEFSAATSTDNEQVLHHLVEKGVSSDSLRGGHG